MSDKPTGVFVRLPLSEAAQELLVDAAAFGKPDDSHDKALLAIGTPVAGGDLYPVGYTSEDAIGGLATGIYSSASIFREKDAEHYGTVSLIRQSDAQAHISALEAEVVRLREAMEEAQGYARKGSWASTHVTLHKALKGGAA